MLSVANKPIMLGVVMMNVVMLSVGMLNVVAPFNADTQPAGGPQLASDGGKVGRALDASSQGQGSEPSPSLEPVETGGERGELLLS